MNGAATFSTDLLLVVAECVGACIGSAARAAPRGPTSARRTVAATDVLAERSGLRNLERLDSTAALSSPACIARAAPRGALATANESPRCTRSAPGACSPLTGAASSTSTDAAARGVIDALDTSSSRGADNATTSRTIMHVILPSCTLYYPHLTIARYVYGFTASASPSRTTRRSIRA